MFHRLFVVIMTNVQIWYVCPSFPRNENFELVQKKTKPIMSKTRKKYVQFRNLIGFICNVMEVWWWSQIDIIILLTMPIQLTTYKEIIVISVRGQSKGQLASSTDSEQVKWKRCRIIVSAIWTSRLSSPFSILLFVQKRKKKGESKPY